MNKYINFSPDEFQIIELIKVHNKDKEEEKENKPKKKGMKEIFMKKKKLKN
jgi:hypothetical protein